MRGVGTAPDAEPATLARFDVVIDARSPAEFALDHVPGAINLPVLSDAERAEVGTIYVQRSHFEARRIGGAYVARNVARHIETTMSGWGADRKLLIYCWRGGMRSNAMALVLSQVGWRTEVLEGGYRTYRRRVSVRLYDGEPLRNVVLLDGPTGSGKTEVLHRLAARGVQIIDLEALACHRGSLFGALPGRPQPSQKLFESRLLQAIDAIDPSRRVVVEAESSKIGQLMTPPVLWSAMATAPRMQLTAPAELRARYLARTYAEAGTDLEALIVTLHRLPDRLGRKRLAELVTLAEQGAFEALAAELIEAHYDPAYRRSANTGGPSAATVELTRLDERGFEDAANEVALHIA